MQIKNNLCYNEKSLVVKHFIDIVLKSEYGHTNLIIKKWNKSKPIVVNIYGNYNNSDIDIINVIIQELRHLTNLNISLSTRNGDNQHLSILVYFGTAQDYIIKYNKNLEREPNAKAFFTYYTSPYGEIINASIFVSEKLSGMERVNIIKEELTQVLGFTNDSNIQIDSIFYQYKYKNPMYYNGGYSDLDKDIIKLLYDDNIMCGWSYPDLMNYLTHCNEGKKNPSMIEYYHNHQHQYSNYIYKDSLYGAYINKSKLCIICIIFIVIIFIVIIK